MVEEQHRFLKKLIFKLVKKHIAGTTSASAIKTLQQLNDKKLTGVVTFLNENDITKVKARYNANSYMQLMKQLSRLNIKSDVSIRPSQIGYGIDRKAAEENMSDIVECAESNAINVWIENGMYTGNIDPLGIYKTHKSKMLCFELPINAIYKLNNGMGKMLGNGSKVKILPYINYREGAGTDKKHMQSPEHIISRKKELDAYSDIVHQLLNKEVKVTLFSSDEKFLARFAELNKDYRRNSIEHPTRMFWFCRSLSV